MYLQPVVSLNDNLIVTEQVKHILIILQESAGSVHMYTMYRKAAVNLAKRIKTSLKFKLYVFEYYKSASREPDQIRNRS